MKKPYFVLRHKGSSDFVRVIHHNFWSRNFVSGWEDLAERGALVFGTAEQAEHARAKDHDGDSIMVEEITETV